jgi:hypothetical protein
MGILGRVDPNPEFGKIECWNCGKKGHPKKDCRTPKKQRDGQTGEKSGSKCNK